MKRYFVLILGILIFYNCKAQYQSVLGDTNQYWKVYKEHVSLGVEVYADSIYLGESFQFNGHEYVEKYSMQSKNYQPPIPTGYLREDTVNGKLWFLTNTSSSGSEHLVYDFTLSIGDTFDIPALGPIRFVVQERDTILGRQKILLRSIYDSIDIMYPFLTNYLYQIDTLIFYEGIGSSLGLDNRLYRDIITGEKSKLLLCHFKDSIQTFQHQLSDSLSFLGQCDTTTPPNMITSTENKLIQKASIFLSPNPTNGILKLQTQAQVQSIEVYNLQGQKVQEISPRTRKWELPEKSGLYLIRIQDVKGRVYTEKVIKN